VFLLVTAAGLLIAWNWNRVGIDVTAQEANRSLHQAFSVPGSATRIRFLSNPRHTMLTFQVSQESFDAWCASMKFKKRLITPESAAPGFDIVDGDTVRLLVLEEGVSFSSFSDDQDCGICGTYISTDGTCRAEFFCK